MELGFNLKIKVWELKDFTGMRKLHWEKKARGKVRKRKNKRLGNNITTTRAWVIARNSGRGGDNYSNICVIAWGVERDPHPPLDFVIFFTIVETYVFLDGIVCNMLCHCEICAIRIPVHTENYTWCDYVHLNIVVVVDMFWFYEHNIIFFISWWISWWLCV